MGDLKLVGIDHLSPSGGNKLIGCERQFVAQYGPEIFRDPPTEATAIGGGFAHALEFGLEAGLKEYTKRRPRTDPIFTDPEEDERLQIVADAIIRHAYAAYRERWSDDTVEREVTYLVRVPGVRRVLQVRVDGYDHAGGHLLEDKLRSASTLQADKLENEIRQGKQLSAEIYGHWKKTGQLIPIDFRNLRKPDPRTLKGPKDDRVPHDAIDSIVKGHFEKPIAVQQYQVTRTVEQLEQWEAEFVAMASRAELLLTGNVQPIRNPDACHAYGRTCPLLAHCQGIV